MSLSLQPITASRVAGALELTVGKLHPKTLLCGKHLDIILVNIALEDDASASVQRLLDTLPVGGTRLQDWEEGFVDGQKLAVGAELVLSVQQIRPVSTLALNQEEPDIGKVGEDARESVRRRDVLDTQRLDVGQQRRPTPQIRRPRTPAAYIVKEFIVD